MPCHQKISFTHRQKLLLDGGQKQSLKPTGVMTETETVTAQYDAPNYKSLGHLFNLENYFVVNSRHRKKRLADEEQKPSFELSKSDDQYC